MTDIIKTIYDNTAKCYGSIQNTFKQAHVNDPSINYEDVKTYLNNLPHRQTQFKHKGYSSFISPHPLFEIEVDVIDLTTLAEANAGFRYAMTAIDKFTKYAHAVPINTKTSSDIVSAITEVFSNIGTPKQLYSDQERSFTSPEFSKLINSCKIKHIMPVSGAHTVERLNRTIKEHIHTRLDAMGLDPDNGLVS